MTQAPEMHPQWLKYRALIDETTEIEYRIIGILSNALCRKEGNGQPNASEATEIQEMKAILHPKLEELKKLHTEVSEFIKQEKALSSSRILR